MPAPQSPRVKRTGRKFASGQRIPRLGAGKTSARRSASPGTTGPARSKDFHKTYPVNGIRKLEHKVAEVIVSGQRSTLVGERGKTEVDGKEQTNFRIYMSADEIVSGFSDKV